MICKHCGEDFDSLGIMSHRAWCGSGYRRRTTREIKQSACRQYETPDGWQHKRELQPMPKSSIGRWVWQAYSPAGFAGLARTDAQLAKRSTREIWPAPDAEQDGGVTVEEDKGDG